MSMQITLSLRILYVLFSIWQTDHVHRRPVLLLYLRLVLISYKPHVAPLYNQVTIKPGQRLYLVNQQYPYRVKFTEDTSTPRSAADLTTPSKRPHQMIREKIKSTANPASTPHTDHHRMSDDSPPPKKTLPSESDKSVSFLWLQIHMLCCFHHWH